MMLVCMVLFLGSLVSVEYMEAADRFVNKKDGTVTDTQTGLMWAAQDNGSKINWVNAKNYCEGYNGSGKSGWRMPTITELGELYSSGAYGSVIKKTGRAVWSSETQGSNAAYFSFTNGSRIWYPQSTANTRRALPVRSDK